MMSPDDVARQMARQNVSALFQFPQDLDKVGAALAEHRQKLLLAESQLGAAVEAQLSDLHGVVGLASECRATFAGVGRSFEGIAKVCRDCESEALIENYPYVRRVQLARRNMRLTLDQYDTFKDIPTRVEG